jgi:hypothetical protein
MIIVTKPMIKIIKNEKYEDENLNLQHLEIAI